MEEVKEVFVCNMEVAKEVFVCKVKDMSNLKFEI